MYSPEKCNEQTNSDQHFLNRIQASKEILKNRKEDLSLTDFDLKHLPPNKAEILNNMLVKNYCVFSKSLNTLGHTDKIILNLKFINDYPIKTLSFPIPQALQKDALEQINQLLQAGIIEKHCSECPFVTC